MKHIKEERMFTFRSINVNDAMKENTTKTKITKKIFASLDFQNQWKLFMMDPVSTPHGVSLRALKGVMHEFFYLIYILGSSFLKHGYILGEES
jgi:hypothetical protein